MTLSPGRPLVDKRRILSVEMAGKGVGHAEGLPTRPACPDEPFSAIALAAVADGAL
jgi:hypothetical protein